MIKNQMIKLSHARDKRMTRFGALGNLDLEFICYLGIRNCDFSKIVFCNYED
jgi:hypothetical protein